MPEIAFRNQSWMDHLRDSRFPALAGWQKDYGQIFAVLNEVTYQIFSQFQINGVPARPENEVWYGQGGKGFGWGTVHHAAGSLRMPYRPRSTARSASNRWSTRTFASSARSSLYVCDMSVMPFSSAANPVAPWPRWPFGSPITWPDGRSSVISVQV